MQSMIPSALRRQRNTKKRTLGVLAGLAGMSPQHLSEVESGKVDPRLSTVERICDALGLTVMLVPKAEAARIRRFLATDGRNYQSLKPGELHDSDFQRD